MAQTIFNNPFKVPAPFSVGGDPGNIRHIPNFAVEGYIQGSTPQVLAPQGPKPQTFRGILSGLLPQKRAKNVKSGK